MSNSLHRGHAPVKSRRGLAAKSLCVAALIGAGGGAFSHAATVGTMESWSEGSNTLGWTVYDLINEKPASLPVAEDGSLKVAFRQQSMKRPPEEFLIKADACASGSAFAGNYLTNGVMAIHFKLSCDQPMDAWVVLFSESSRRWWRFGLGLQRTGEWVDVSVPVEPSILRSISGVQGAEAFEQDLADVSWVGIVVRRNSRMDAQNFRIDEFWLEGPGPDFASWMSQFPAATNGCEESNRLPHGDLDGDGASNYEEWTAGTSAADKHDKLTVTIDAEQTSGNPGVVVKWNGRSQRIYSVWRSSDMKSGFSRISPDISAGNTFEDSGTGGMQFYRVQVRMEAP